MQFDPENRITPLCVQGMEKEGQGKAAEARKLFIQAWESAANPFEKCIAAHYVARHQKTIEDKLHWDTIALNFALMVEQQSIQSYFPSLYLNIARCYEDLNDFDTAHKNYCAAHSYLEFLPDDGYGQMIRYGIQAGITRISSQ